MVRCEADRSPSRSPSSLSGIGSSFEHRLDDRDDRLLVVGERDRRVALLEQQVGPVLAVADARLEPPADDQVEQRRGQRVAVAGPGVALVRQRQRHRGRRVVGRLREVGDGGVLALRLAAVAAATRGRTARSRPPGRRGSPPAPPAAGCRAPAGACGSRPRSGRSRPAPRRRCGRTPRSSSTTGRPASRPPARCAAAACAARRTGCAACPSRPARSCGPRAATVPSTLPGGPRCARCPRARRPGWSASRRACRASPSSRRPTPARTRRRRRRAPASGRGRGSGSGTCASRRWPSSARRCAPRAGRSRRASRRRRRCPGRPKPPSSVLAPES